MDFSQIGSNVKSAYNGYKYSKRAWESPGFLRKLQNNYLRKTVQNAYELTDFYKKKFDRHGVSPKDIKSVEDLHKLPIITKNDFIKNSHLAIPKSLDRKKAVCMGTSGSTGQPLQVYKDHIWRAHFIGYLFRMRKLHKMGMPKAAFIADIGSSSSIETKTYNYMKLITANRIAIINVDQDINKIMLLLEKADVRYIATYTTVMRELAFLRNNGMGKKLNLIKIGLTGEILDDFTREYIEKAFGCACYSSYISTEAGAIAIECENKKMHVNSDSVMLEVVDDNGNVLPYGKDGNIILTCIDGGYSTPVIRYSGCADAGHLLPEKCTCGMNTPVIGPIKGRIADSIHLPDGRIYHSFTMTIPMEKILKGLGKNLIRQYQIVQEKLDKVSISLVKNQKNQPSDEDFNKVMQSIKQTYQDQLGSGIDISVNQFPQLPKGNNVGMPTPLVVSMINKDRIIK